MAGRATAASRSAAGRRVLSAKADAFAARIGPMVCGMRAEGRSLREIAATLAEQGIRTPRGGAWTAAAVNGVLARVLATEQQGVA